MIHGDMNRSTVKELRRRDRLRDPDRAAEPCEAAAVATWIPPRSRSELHLVVDLLREALESRLHVGHFARLELGQEVPLLIRRVRPDRRQRRIESRVLV